MVNVTLCQRVVVAADASARASFAPPSGVTWLLKKLWLVPNETSATNDTNYASIEPKKGSTALATARVTTAAGGALTQDDPVNFTLTGTPTQLECTQADPHHVLVDAATNGTGVAVDVSIFAEYQVLR
jgi:hypothetical protein